MRLLPRYDHRGELLYIVPGPDLGDRRRVGRAALAGQLAGLVQVMLVAGPLPAA
jgi:hypothetical protein